MEQNVNIFTLIFSMPIIFWISILFIVLISIFRKQITGYMGEFWVRTKLEKLPKDKYKVLHDIMIKIDNKTHQIDHIVVSTYGIFVIETKNYGGLITGSSNNNNWCMHLGKNKYYFNNPIHQNYGHIVALEKLLGIEESKFISIISMSNKAKIKVQEKNVITLDYLVSTINNYKNLILDININEITNKIKSNNITDKELRKIHVKNIKRDITNKQKKLNNMICPRCGATLIIRNGKNGEFVGCTNYPKCRFTKNIEK